MLLLISGASSAGKTTVRTTVSFRTPGPPSRPWSCATSTPVPPVPDMAWRQRMAERAVARARLLEDDGRHLLLAGDPVAPGEVLAAPSAAAVDIAICLLDVTEDAQMERLRRRGEPEELLSRHVAFADWLRRHAQDPSHMPHVLTTDGWSAMQWSRLSEMGREQWRMTVIDGSAGGVAETGCCCACNGLTTLWPVAHRCFAELFDRWALPTSTEAGQHRPNYREDENVGSRDSADLCDRRPDQPDDDE